MQLETVFYIMAIVYMGIMFILMIIALAAVLAIKRRINEIHRNIEEKIHSVTNAFQVGEAIVEKAKNAFGKK
jgi:cell division protein FtsL